MFDFEISSEDLASLSDLNERYSLVRWSALRLQAAAGLSENLSSSVIEPPTQEEISAGSTGVRQMSVAVAVSTEITMPRPRSRPVSASPTSSRIGGSACGARCPDHLQVAYCNRNFDSRKEVDAERLAPRPGAPLPALRLASGEAEVS